MLSVYMAVRMHPFPRLPPLYEGVAARGHGSSFSSMYPQSGGETVRTLQRRPPYAFVSGVGRKSAAHSADFDLSRNQQEATTAEHMLWRNARRRGPSRRFSAYVLTVSL
jgi:hypothetical protein